MYNKNIQEEFNELVEKHGLISAIHIFWDEHTSINLKRIVAVLGLIWVLRFGFSYAGFGGTVSFIAPLVAAFIISNIYYRVRK